MTEMNQHITIYISGDPCIDFECYNDGSCFHDGNTEPQCNCTKGYEGEHCEERKFQSIRRQQDCKISFIAVIAV